MDHPSAALPVPELSFEEGGTVLSARFGDVYFSRSGGREETEHVFLKGNGLPGRWCAARHFSIGELGFGSGLNFLVTWQQFLETAPPEHHLHYLSFEYDPFTPEQLRRAHGDHPLLGKLLAQYPLRLPGLHRVHLGRVTLTLAFGDARQLLPSTESGITDAWFLDGFAPAKNPELWDDDLLRHVARCSAPGATFATFTAASAVRRTLEAHGFTVTKQKGFGKKREMLVGQFVSGDAGAPAPAPSRLASGLRTHNRNVPSLIVGGGIAGCCAARALAERGMRVTLLEARKIAGGASGNVAAALYPQITKHWQPATAWHATAYAFTLRQLRRWKAEGLFFAFASPGMVKLAMRADEEERLRGVHTRLGLDPAIATWCGAEVLSEKAGIPLPRGGVWFPEGSWVCPPALCRSLLDHPHIACHEAAEVAALARVDDGWTATTADGRQYHAKIAVLANAHDAVRFVPQLALGTSAGQVSVLDTRGSTPLRTIVCHSGYMIPQGDTCLIGATYDHDDFSCRVTDASHAHNIAELERAVPGWLTQPVAVDGRSSLRATTPDRLPYVGKVQEGLYVSTGFGSRGMISAPLAAEVIASHIAGDMVPLTARLKAAVAPNRRQTASSAVPANPSRRNTAS